MKKKLGLFASALNTSAASVFTMFAAFIAFATSTHAATLTATFDTINTSVSSGDFSVSSADGITFNQNGTVTINTKPLKIDRNSNFVAAWQGMTIAMKFSNFTASTDDSVKTFIGASGSNNARDYMGIVTKNANWRYRWQSGRKGSSTLTAESAGIVIFTHKNSVGTDLITYDRNGLRQVYDTKDFGDIGQIGRYINIGGLNNGSDINTGLTVHAVKIYQDIVSDAEIQTLLADWCVSTATATVSNDTNYDELVWLDGDGNSTQPDFFSSSASLTITLSDGARLTLPDRAIYCGTLTVNGEGSVAFSPNTEVVGTFLKGANVTIADPYSLTVEEDTTVSELNALAAADAIKLHVTPGVTITIDEAPTPVYALVCAGSMTLAADENYTPTAADYAKFNGAGVTGGLLRSWITPGVIGFNFNAAGARNGTREGLECNDTTTLPLESGTWSYNAYDPSGSFSALFADGLSTLSWSSKNVYSEADGITGGNFIQGYLDDGNGIEIKLSAVPYETYDVIIYCSTDDASKSFTAKKVNGTIYAWDDDAHSAVVTNSMTATWGLASMAAGRAVYGANTIRVNGLSGPLKIESVVQKIGTNNGARGCISAIQIMPSGTSTAPTLTAGAEGVTTLVEWSDATKWNTADAPTSGAVILHVTGNVVVTADESLDLTAVNVEGSGTLTLRTAAECTFTADSISSALPITFGERVNIDTLSVAATCTYEGPVSHLVSAPHGNIYTGGAGSVDGATTNAVNLQLIGGWVEARDATYYFEDGFYGAQTTATFTNATVVYTNGLSIGNAAYVMAGNTAVTCVPKVGTKPRSLYLSDGENNRTATILLKDNATLTSLGLNNVDSNAGAVLFGHYNGTSIFTIQDNATFTAAGEVLVGKTSGSNTINLNGGTFNAQGIKVSAGAGGTQALNLNGGALFLGDIGVSAYGTYTIPVNVNGNSTITATAATMPITQPITVAEGKTLTFAKAAELDAVEVLFSASFTGDGAITVGEGVTLSLSDTTRPRLGAISGTVKVTLSDAELGTMSVSLPTTLSEAPATSAFAATDGGSPLTVQSVALSEGVLTLTLSSENEIITTSTNASELDPDMTGALIVVGESAENPIVFNFDAALPEGITGVSLRGTVGIRGELPANVTFGVDSTIITFETYTIANTDPTVSYIVRGGTLTLETTNATLPHHVTVDPDGTYDINGLANRSYPITLNGGTLINLGSEVGVGQMQFWQMDVTADSYIDTTNNFGSIASGYGNMAFNLNGHKLTKKGPGSYYISNGDFYGGGTLEVQEGTFRLFKGFTVMDDTTLNIVIASGATFTMEAESAETLRITKNPGGRLNLENDGLLNLYLVGTLPDSPKFDTRTGDGTVLVRNGWNGGRLIWEDALVSTSGRLISNGNYGWMDIDRPSQNKNITSCILELKDNGTTPALKLTDGSSDRTYQIKHLEGDGTFTIVPNANAWGGNSLFIFNDTTNFTGSIDLSASNSKPVLFSTTATSGTRSKDGSITVDVGTPVTIANGKTWAARGAFTMNGDFGGSGKISGSSVTIANNLTYTYDGHPMTIATDNLTFGKILYVKGTEIVDGSILFQISSPSLDTETLPHIRVLDENNKVKRIFWLKSVQNGTLYDVTTFTPGFKIKIR